MKKSWVGLLNLLCMLTSTCLVALEGSDDADALYDQLRGVKKHTHKQDTNSDRRHIIRKDDEGDTYVIPWDERNEYYGYPPPKVLNQPNQNSQQNQ